MDKSCLKFKLNYLFMANIFFYTDPERIMDQTNDASTGFAFGPIDADKYRFTSRHKTVLGGAKAIAVFDGTIIALDSIGSNLTLVLKPDTHIRDLSDVDLPEIKYVIYKAIKQESLIDPDLSRIAPAISNDLTQAIWETQIKYNNAFGSSFDPPIESLKLNLSPVPDPDVDIDFLFNALPDSYFEPQRIKAGDYIGDFYEDFGVEFVTNEVRSKISYSEAISLDFVYDVTLHIGSARRKNAKERILRFIDPTTFYGSLYVAESGNKLGIKRHDNTVEVFNGKNVYDKYLLKLNNKNRLYIDIRNEYNQSYNFLNVYDDTIKLKLGVNGAFNDVDYYQDWPILILEKGVDGAAYDPSLSGVERKNSISIKLPVSADPIDNQKPVILSYIDYREIQGIPKKFRFSESDKKFENLERSFIGIGSFYKEIDFQLPNANTGGTYIDPITTYLRLKIFRSESKLISNSIILRPENYIDALFLPLAIEKVYPSGMEVRTFLEDVYLGTKVELNDSEEELGVLNFVNDNDLTKTDFTSSVGYAFESEFVTFFSFANRRRSPSNIPQININRLEYSSQEEFLNSVSDRYSEGQSQNPIISKVELDPPMTVGQKLYKFKPVSNLTQRYKINLADEFSAISISAASYDLLKNSIDPSHPSFNGINSNYDVHLVLRKREKNLAQLHTSVPPDMHAFSSYELYLRGVQEADVNGNTINAILWSSGIELLAYSNLQDRNQPTLDDKSMIVIEKGVELIDTIEDDSYLPCYRNTLEAEEINDLKKFITQIRTRLQFAPNETLYKKIFYGGAGTSVGSIPSPGFTFELDNITGEVSFKDPLGLNLNYFPNYQAKGFLMESAIIFAIWNLCCMLSDESDSNENNYLYEELFKILHNNGLSSTLTSTQIKSIKIRLFNPFNGIGERYSYPDPLKNANGADFNWPGKLTNSYYIVSPNFNYGYPSTGTIQAMLGTQPRFYETSFKHELFNLIRSGNLNSVKNSSGVFEEVLRENTEPKLFTFPNSITSRNILKGGASVNMQNRQLDSKLETTVSNYIKPLVGKICFEFVQLIKSYISKNAYCYYSVFTKNLDVKNAFEPQFRMMATGEGSATTGVTSPIEKVKLRSSSGADFFGTDVVNGLGSLLFTYNVDPNTGDVSFKNEERFNTITVDTTVGVHLSIFGMDNGAPNIVEVELNGPHVGGSGDKILFRFVGEQDFSSANHKLFPEHSLTIPLGSTPTVPPHLVHPKEKRVSLHDFGTQLVPRSSIPGGLGEIVNVDFDFIDISGNIIATYYAEWQNIIFKIKPNYDITVRLFSGQQQDPDPANLNVAIDERSIFCDEVQLAISVFDFEPPVFPFPVPQRFEILAEDLYADDKFELTLSKKLELIENSDRYPNAKNTYKKLAKLIHESLVSSDEVELNISLFGNNIGVKNPRSGLIERDIRFAFSNTIPFANNSQVRPETLIPTLGLTWEETDPDPSGVSLGYIYTYHSNDPNGNRTRLLEIPKVDPSLEDELIPLRFSIADIDVTKPDFNKTRIQIKIDSFVSPVWSRLDQKIQNDYRHTLPSAPGYPNVEGLTETQRLTELNSNTLYNAGTGTFADGSTISDAYIKLVLGGGGYAYRGSFNPLLSCLRSFGLMEAIRDNIFHMATHVSDDDDEILTSTEAEAIRAFIQTIIDAVVITADVSIGFPLDVTYDVYQRLKWYYDEADKNEYVEP